MTSSNESVNSSLKQSQVKDAKETFQAILELSKLLGTGLDPEALSICVRLCEAGMNPQTLALVIKELQKEVARHNETKLQE